MWPKLQFSQIQDGGGRHFENSIISISQPRIIRFRSNLVGRCISQFPWWTFNKKIEIMQIQDGGRTPDWKSFFGYISAPYWPINAKFGTEMKDHMPYSPYSSFGNVTYIDRSRYQNCNFRKLKMADGRHFENSIISISQPRIIRFRPNLVGRCTSQFPWWAFNKKIEIMQIQDGGRTPYWKSFFAYISAPYWPINSKFGTEMKDHMPI